MLGTDGIFIALPVFAIGWIGDEMLVAIFAERESHAAYFLQEQEMTRYDAVNYISHGIAKRPGMSEARPVRGGVRARHGNAPCRHALSRRLRRTCFSHLLRPIHQHDLASAAACNGCQRDRVTDVSGADDPEFRSHHLVTRNLIFIPKTEMPGLLAEALAALAHGQLPQQGCFSSVLLINDLVAATYIV
jgi:hypothetical protein